MMGSDRIRWMLVVCDNRHKFQELVSIQVVFLNKALVDEDSGGVKVD